jgi:preprotein translocase subunit SecE
VAFLSKFKQSFSFFTDSWSELKKVRWPGRKELITYTLVVLFTVIFVTLYFYLMDLGISRIIESVF